MSAFHFNFAESEQRMAHPKTEKIWHNGKFIAWDDAKIHVLSHVVNYGSGRLRRNPLLRHDSRALRFSVCASTCSAC